ncbi:unnamed protein product [Coffea canephora]|uniref:Ubiquitin-like protease family profile domain-containing protein n=1 Tax=Coffea canephora TaxID=49390 RepID=A0A068UME2_COFCA|nr:unnamed protein product [Coffea canephora]
MQEIYAKTNLIRQHFQPGQMSESKGEPKERTDVVDTGPVEYDNTESHQQAAQYPRPNKLKSMQEIYAKTNLICQHFQPGQMSESRGEPKERTDVVDTEGVTSRHPRKNQIKSRRHSTRNGKSKALTDTTDSDVSPPLQVCGKLQGPVESDNLSAEEEIKIVGESFIEDDINAYPLRTRSRRSRRMVNRSGSEVTIPRKRVRRQPRRPLNFSTSITSEGVLSSRQFYRYMDHIWSEVSAEKRNSIACMDCLWFNTYAESKWKEKVLKWIEREDIFSKKYVLVPIVLWSHWNLLIFCHFGESLQSESSTPCMLLLDSLHMTDPKRLEPLIRKFVMDIYKNEKRPETKELIRKIPLLVPSIPQQIDDKKCGYFVLYYIYLFIKNAPEMFSIDEGYPYFMTEDWFTLEELDGFCRTLESVRVDTTSSDE